MEYRRAERGDSDRIMTIIGQAKSMMLREGRHQWTESYPSRGDIAADIVSGNGRVLCLNGEVVAYGAVVFTGEVAYDALCGEWSADIPYVVVHRLAVAEEIRHQGVARCFMTKVEEEASAAGVHSFRVDTNYDNRYLLRLLESLRFAYCGTVEYKQGQRMAYEKLI